MKRLFVFVLLALVVASGCGRETEAPPVNLAPETTVQADPPVTTLAGRSVWVYFSGVDRDGDVVAYEWAVAVAGATREGLAWTRTIEASVEIVFGAAEVEAGDVQRTIHVRAIDDDGAVDPTPAVVSFSPLTLSPTVQIDLPAAVPSITCTQVPVLPFIGWTASDPDSPAGAPEAVRLLVLTDLAPVPGNCITLAEFEASSPFRTIATEDPRWGEWIPYDPLADVFDPSRSTQLDLPEDGTPFLVAAQARDFDGAITKEFEWGINVRHLRTSSSVFPVLRVEEPILGSFVFVGLNQVKVFDVVAGQIIDFRLDSAGADGSLVEGYRWGWNITDPDDPDDPGWAVPWGIGEGWENPPARSFSQGSPSFVAQARDHAGTITRATFLFQVVQLLPPEFRKDVLLVDDWPSGGAPSEELLEIEWDAWWNARLENVAGGFMPAQDVIDAQSDPTRLTLRNLLDYKTVVWFVNASQASFLHSRFTSDSGSSPPYNWLEMYRRYGGNLLLAGPGAMYASVERRSVPWLFPIIFDTPEGFPFGFGIDFVDGHVVNRGTWRYPYQGFCLEAIDMVRPPFGSIFGEGTTPLRSLVCDGVYQAQVAPEFEALSNSLVTLRPVLEREELSPYLQLPFEEFYNVNVTSRDIDLVLRDCQVPMFVGVTRGDAGAQTSCIASPNGYAPIAVRSTAHGEDKPLPGGDYVWGFNPVGFVAEDVEAALAWIVQEDWQLAPAP